MSKPQPITFDDWNEIPNQFKPDFKASNEPLLEAIEKDPEQFDYFDDGTVRNYCGVFVIEQTDYSHTTQNKT